MDPRTSSLKLQEYLRKTFGNALRSKFARVRRRRTCAEVFVDGEFIAVLLREEEDGEVSYQFQMAILDLDLEEALIAMPCRSMSSTASASETPGEGRYWVAPSAVLIGKVDPGGGGERLVRHACSAATTSRSASARARTCRKAACCTPTRAIRSTIGAELHHRPHGHAARLHDRPRQPDRHRLDHLNGAKIGEECLIGANTLIAEGKEIPPRSMVLGSPGKIVRQLSDEDAQALRRRGRALREELEAVCGGDEAAGGKLSGARAVLAGPAEQAASGSSSAVERRRYRCAERRQSLCRAASQQPLLG